MNFWEYLDRRAERLASKPVRDIRQIIGFGFLAGYYGMVFAFAREAIPGDNVPLIRDAMLTLGPPVGIIVNGMFRSDAREEQATRNTATAFEALKAAASPGEPTVTLKPGETAQAATEELRA